MIGIDSGSLVIIHCTNPKDKMWGVLLRLDATGAVMRGMDLNTVEDWLQQEKAGGTALIGPSTFFLPVHRIVRIDLDESGEVVESYGDRYRASCDRDARTALIGNPVDEDAE